MGQTCFSFHPLFVLQVRIPERHLLHRKVLRFSRNVCQPSSPLRRLVFSCPQISGTASILLSSLEAQQTPSGSNSFSLTLTLPSSTLIPKTPRHIFLLLLSPWVQLSGNQPFLPSEQPLSSSPSTISADAVLMLSVPTLSSVSSKSTQTSSQPSPNPPSSPPTLFRFSPSASPTSFDEPAPSTASSFSATSQTPSNKLHFPRTGATPLTSSETSLGISK